MLVLVDDTDRIKIWDGEYQSVLSGFEYDLNMARRTLEAGHTEAALEYARSAELKRDVLSVIQATRGNIQLPLGVRSVQQFTQLWEGNVGTVYTHIVGHIDGEVSLLDEFEYQGALVNYGRSNWVCIEHQAPKSALELVVPTPDPNGVTFSPTKLLIKTFEFNPDPRIHVSIRAACDMNGGVWIKCGEPEIRLYNIKQNTVAMPAQIATANIRDWPLAYATEFVEAAVDAAKSIV